MIRMTGRPIASPMPRKPARNVTINCDLNLRKRNLDFDGGVHIARSYFDSTAYCLSFGIFAKRYDLWIPQGALDIRALHDDRHIADARADGDFLLLQHACIDQDRDR